MYVRAFTLIAVLVLSILNAVSVSMAVEPDEVLKDPKLEARAMAISAKLRCVKCRNQTIDDSNADVAKSLRILVRERLKAGDTDQQVIDYIVSRYGETILLLPRIALHTILLWLSPLLFLLIGSVLIWKLMSGRNEKNVNAVNELSQEEEKKLEQILREES